MRRRLAFSMIAMVIATLVLSGLVSLAVAQRSTVDQTRRELVREGQGLAAAVRQEADTRRDPATALRTLLLGLRAPLRLDGSAVLAVQPTTGRLFDPASPRVAPDLPAGLTQSDLDPAALLQLRTVSGRHRAVVYAAVPYRSVIEILGAARQVTQVVVLTRRPPSALSTAGPWFAWSALVILLVAALVAVRLGRRFVAPIRQAEEVTSRIAAGDLDARVPEPPGRDPELAALSAAINSMAANLARARGAERAFIQSVSHDLRTPLTSIRGFAEAIEDGATADAVEAAGVIAGEARRLERLVGDLLALATLESRRFSLDLQPVDLAGAVTASASGFLPAATELGLSITASTPPAPCWVRADPDRLAQISANLIENALRYAGSHVQVGAIPVGDRVELAVSDDGPGIPGEDLPRVFERLYSGRPRPNRPIGSGLGLAIVAELAQAMGATVRAESPVGPRGGTRMVVSLPGHQVDGRQEAPDRTPTQAAQATHPAQPAQPA